MSARVHSLFTAGARWGAVAFALLGSACRPWQYEEGYPFTTLDPSSDFGNAIQKVYATFTYVDLVIAIVVGILLFYTLFRFRDDGSKGNPEQIHGNLQMEIGWTLVPVVIVILLLVPTVRTIFEIGSAAPKDSLEVRVTGKRWWWAFEYVASGVKTANELHLPAGRPVSLLIESDSVIHSFWTPRIGGKRDAVPGRTNKMWFTITDPIQPGKAEIYRGECAEYCGEAHALMRYDIIGHEANEFDQWLAAMKAPAQLPADPLVEKGKQAFTSGGCVGCHTIVGNDQAQGTQGPNLTRFGNRMKLAAGTVPNTTENLSKWLHDPNSVKPGTTKDANASRALDGMNIPVKLTDDDVTALVAYLQAQK